MMQEQIIELQTRLAFQEEQIHALNQTVNRQQRMLDELQRELSELRRRLRAFTPALLDPGMSEPLPPHY